MSDLNLERLRYSGYVCMFLLASSRIHLCLKIVSGLETVLRLTIG